MEIKVMINEKLNSVFDSRKKHRGVRHKLTKRCYSKAEIIRAVKEYALKIYNETGSLPNEVYIANEPKYSPWRSFKFRLLKSGVYSFRRLVYWFDMCGITPYVMVREGDNVHENTYGSRIDDLRAQLNSSLLTDYIRKEKLPVNGLYDVWYGYSINGCAIVAEKGEIMLFGDHKKLSEQEVIELLKSRT